MRLYSLPMLTVTFLGTSAARPTVERIVSELSIHREGETLIFECGEGTQRQMMSYGVSFALSEIFFTHFHADHFLGVIGLIRTLGLQGRPEPLLLYGPKGAKKVLSTALQLGVERVPFPVEIMEVKAGDTIGDGGRGKREGYDIYAFPAEDGEGSRASCARVQSETIGSLARFSALLDQRGRAGQGSARGVSQRDCRERWDGSRRSICRVKQQR